MTEYFEPDDFPIQEGAVTEYFNSSSFSIQGDTMTQHVKPTGVLVEPTVGPAREQAMIEHFELAQGSRGSLPEAELDHHGRVVELRSKPAEFDKSKFIKLSCESFPDLGRPQLKFLSEICLVAHRSEEFFLTTDRNQWVRTSITSNIASQDLFSSASIVEEECSKLISSITIHSNVLPRDPFWTKAREERNGTSQRVHFPCSILKEALEEEKTLMHKVLEWRKTRDECNISQHGLKRPVQDGNTIEDPLRMFWEIRADVKPLKELAKGADGTIWLVTWRGGRFVRKDRRRTSNIMEDSNPRKAIDPELNVVEMLSHPHIVYSFGVSYAANKSSLFMEYMQNDLFHCIVDRVRIMGDNEPPFSHQESVDILLQFAKAMAHMHKENVVHGDLKSLNILISEILISENVKHFLVKVADFGSARLVSSKSGSTGFKPGAATTKYAAPEVLKFRSNQAEVISFPDKIDVYSFGIVAFEVLTGEELYSNVRSQTKLRNGVIDGTLRPPLHANCRKNKKFQNDKKLIPLIESCWHGDPSKRPSFSKIVRVLNNVLNPKLRSGHRSRHVKFVDDTPCAVEDPAPVVNSRHPSRVPLQYTGMRVTKELFAQVLHEEIVHLEKEVESAKFANGKFKEAADFFAKQCTAPVLDNFFTLDVYCNIVRCAPSALM